MKKIKIIGLVIISIIFLISTVHIINKIKEKREKATPTEIENVNLYEKNQILKLLKEEYPEDEFEIICYLSDINKSPSKWSPSERKVGKKVMVRPNGQIGEEFLVKYYDDDEDKFFSTPIKPIITAYYKEEETIEIRRVYNMLEEYIQTIVDENLGNKYNGEDYRMIVMGNSDFVYIDVEWLKNIENIDDFFYTIPKYNQDRRIINVLFLMNDDSFKDDDLYLYYNCFENIANNLLEKSKDEKSIIETYSISIVLYRLNKEKFDRIKKLSSNEIFILWDNTDLIGGKRYHYTLNKKYNENSEITIEKEDYETFKQYMLLR